MMEFYYEYEMAKNLKFKPMRDEVMVRLDLKLDDPNWCQDNPDYVGPSESLMEKIRTDERNLITEEAEMLEEVLEDFEEGPLETGRADGDPGIDNWRRHLRGLRRLYNIEA